MSSSEEKKGESEIEIFKRVNRLKLKTGASLNDGPGKLDSASVERANSVVMTMASLYPKEIKNVLAALDREWAEMKKLAESNGDSSKQAKKISNTANQIKDLAGTFGYTLMEYFGESLRDYILRTDFSQKAHYVIVQAHIDVMGVAYRENLKNDDGGAAAEELKKMVQTAIEKYS